MEDFEKKTIESYDKMAESWAAAHSTISDWQRYMLEFCELLPSGQVLEVGCGGGRDAEGLIRLGYDYLGTDASKGMVEVAKRRVPNAKFMQLSMYDLGTLSEVFDGFWACASLLHIPKQKIDAVLLAINSKLKPGAIGFISIKEGDSEEFEAREVDGRREERLFVYWQDADFQQVLKHNGFEVLKYEYRPMSERTKWHVYYTRKVKPAS